MGIEEPQTIVYLGNRDAVEAFTDPATGDRQQRTLPGKRCTTVQLEPDLTLMQAAHTITHQQGVWAHHSTGTPAWVASTNQALAQLLAAHFKCELRDPEPDHVPSGSGLED